MELRELISKAHHSIDAGEREQAENFYERAVAVAERPHTNPDLLLLVLLDLAVFYEEEKRVEEAEQVNTRIRQLRMSF